MDTTSSRRDRGAGDPALRRQPLGEAVLVPPGLGSWWERLARRPPRALAAVLVFGLVLYMLGLGQRSLWSPDEGRYAEIPREMIASGDWLTPRLNGVKYFEKPPLHYWLVGAAFQLLGPTEFAARLPCALAAVGALLLVYGFGVACLGAPTGLLAALLLGASPLYFILGRMDIIDTPLMLFYTLGMSAWGLVLLRPHRAGGSAPLALAGWAGLALATLVKGPVALLLALGTVTLWLLVTRRWDRVRLLRPLPGLAVYLAVAAPWFVAVSLKNPEFAWFFFVHEHLLRFLTTEHERKGPIYYYLPVLLVGFFPWSAWLPAAVLASLRSRSPDERRNAPDYARETTLWLLLWAAVPFVFFSASGSKLITYILPAFPALALLVAAWWPRGRAEQESDAAGANLSEGPGPAGHALKGWASFRRAAVGASAGAALMAIILPLLPVLLRNDAAPGVGPWLGLAAAMLAVGAVLTTVFARRREPARVVATLLMVTTGLLAAVDRVELAVDSVRGMRSMAEPVRARPEARLVMVNTYDQALNFYTGKRAILAGGVGELRFGRDHAADASTYFRPEEALPALLADRIPTFFLINRAEYERLRAHFEGEAEVVEQARKRLLLFAPGAGNVAR